MAKVEESVSVILVKAWVKTLLVEEIFWQCSSIKNFKISKRLKNKSFTILTLHFKKEEGGRRKRRSGGGGGRGGGEKKKGKRKKERKRKKKKKEEPNYRGPAKAWFRCGVHTINQFAHRVAVQHH